MAIEIERASDGKRYKLRVGSRSWHLSAAEVRSLRRGLIELGLEDETPELMSVNGTSVLVNGARVDLRFLRTFANKESGSPGETEARVKVKCGGCGRWKTVQRVGLRVTAPGVVDLQPRCHECRAILNRGRR